MGFNFAPLGWATCSGQILPISQYTAVFSLLGTYYGGNGQTNFALPNLAGSIPVDYGSGPGLTTRDLGETGGSTNVNLLYTEMPSHLHNIEGNSNPATTVNPAGALPSVTVRPTYSAPGGNEMFHTNAVVPAGSGNAHNNMQPTLFVNYVIALYGIFPARG